MCCFNICFISAKLYIINHVFCQADDKTAQTKRGGITRPLTFSNFY